ncbi:MAG TPA: peptidoglycan DD-metalloendopeptidase family protein [Gammaproteobacteria bacterium]|nr:peptidoglycan DD-metalloendopeptidase family protein [Gammaproteobacteria bacterium]
MNVIVFTKRGRRHQLHFGQPLGAFALALCLAALIAVPFAAGYFYAVSYGAGNPLTQIRALRAEIAAQRAEIEATRRSAGENVNALAVRLAQLNAHVMRLDALGERLTRMAKLDKGEFDFDQPPAQGGPEELLDAGDLPQLDFLGALDELALRLADREKQLAVLENLLMNRNLQDQVRPAGRPVQNGWISSYFGVRTDPFTGKVARHYGVDFAGTDGAEIVAVAAGVVTWSGPRLGYGNLVEINHGNGFATRYAHNRENLVKVGETVKKGQVIALMGSSGRSTGPHVHFEVLRNGTVVNPQTYIQQAE